MSAGEGKLWSDNVELVAHVTVNVVPNVSLPDVRAILDAVQDWLGYAPRALSQPSNAAPPERFVRFMCVNAFGCQQDSVCVERCALSQPSGAAPGPADVVWEASIDGVTWTQMPRETALTYVHCRQRPADPEINRTGLIALLRSRRALQGSR